jgi:hypothetical protein
MRIKIALHSFSRVVKTVISDQAGQDYQNGSWNTQNHLTKQKKSLREGKVYSTKCMRYLAFLDYTLLTLLH